MVERLKPIIGGVNEILIVSAQPPEATTERRPVVYLRLGKDFQANLESGSSILPKSKKAAAILAFLALAQDNKASRAGVAGMLWSTLERTEALARLRDVLYNCQRHFGAIGFTVLSLEKASIILVRDAVSIDFTVEDESVVGDRKLDYLTDLEGIDPAFDRWLAYIRNKRWQTHTLTSRNVRLNSLDDAIARRNSRMTVLVHEIELLGGNIDAHFARALTQEIAGGLSKFRWFDVTRRRPFGDGQLAMGEKQSEVADYALNGTLQESGGQCRLSLMLTDVSNNRNIVWVASFEQSLKSGFAMQDKFVHVVASRLDSELLLIEAIRQNNRPSVEPEDPYHLVLKAVLAISRLERIDFMGAGHALEQAVTLDRNLPLAHSWLAYWHVFLVGQGWTMNPSKSMVKANEAVERAMMLDPQDARAITIAGHVKAFLVRRLEEAVVLHDLAIRINPALGLAWHLSGMTHAYAGRLDEASQRISYSQSLSDGDAHGHFGEAAMGIVHLLRHEYEEAISVGRRVTERHPLFTSAYKSYLAALGHTGGSSEAIAVLRRLRFLEPRFSLHRFRVTAPYQRREDLEHYLAGLRLAGVN